MNPLKEIAKRKAEIMAILERHADLTEEEFEKTEFAKNNHDINLFRELDRLTNEEAKLVGQN